MRVYNKPCFLPCMQGKLASLLLELGGERSFMESLPSAVLCSLASMGVEKCLTSPRGPPLTILQIHSRCHHRKCP